MHGDPRPSDWIERFASLVPAGGTVLDVAAGAGRHTRLFRRLGVDEIEVRTDVPYVRPLLAFFHRRERQRRR